MEEMITFQLESNHFIEVSSFWFLVSAAGKEQHLGMAKPNKKI